MTPTSRRRVLSALVVVAMAAMSAACGDDGADEASPQGDPDPTTTTTGGGDAQPVGMGDTLEPNVVYEYPMYLHCGLDQLGVFNGTAWVLAEAPGGNPDGGAGQSPPAHWPMGPGGVEGRLVLIDESRIEYSLPDGELIAVYEPTPDPFIPCE